MLDPTPLPSPPHAGSDTFFGDLWFPEINVPFILATLSARNRKISNFLF